MKTKVIAVALAWECVAGMVACIHAAPFTLRGSLNMHDPSSVVVCDGRHYLFGTGLGIVSRSSADREPWTDGSSVFSTPPAWVATAGRLLHKTSELTESTIWSPVGIAPTATNGMHVRTMPLNETKEFYRLQWP